MKAKSLKLFSIVLCALFVLSGCQSMNNTAKGGLIGGGGGAALGALVGTLVSGRSDKGKGAAIGAAIGATANVLERAGALINAGADVLVAGPAYFKAEDKAAFVQLIQS